MSIKVILADDHKIVLDGLRSLLNKRSDVEVIADAGDGRSTVELARKLSPDLVIMDISMPDMNGIEATRRILSENPKIKVIGLSMHSDRRFVVEMLKAGVSGYLLKDCAFEELANAIHSVMKNQIYLCPPIAKTVTEDYLHRLDPTNASSVYSILTPREREVLKLLSEGKTTKQIAYILGLSGKTVETHAQKVMKKLSLHSIAELTKYAIREGLTSLEP